MTLRAESPRPPHFEEIASLVANDLHRLLPPHFQLQELDPVYWRPKGDQGTILSFRCELRDELGITVERWVTFRRAPLERVRLEAERCTEEHVRMAWPLPPCEIDTIESRGLFTFPFDRRLPRLAALLRPRSLVRMLEQGPYGRGEIEKGWRIRKRHSRWDLASYRPERRAVLRWTFGEKNEARNLKRMNSVFVRVHAEARPVPLDLHARLAETGIPAPALLAAPYPTVQVESVVPGQSPSTLELPRLGDLERVGRLLARWHRDGSTQGLQHRKWEDALAQAEASVSTLAQASPAEAGRVEARLQSLRSLAPPPEECVAVHGDLHPGQWVSDGTQIFLVDWDRAAASSPAEDLAPLLVHLEARGGIDSSAAFRALRSGYASVTAWPREDAMRAHLEAARLRLCDLPYRRPGSVGSDWLDAVLRKSDEAMGGESR